MPTIQRQPPGMLEKSHPITYATTCPPVVKSGDTVTRRPRRWLGDSSEMYNGTIGLAPPIARPTKPRPSIISHTELATACHNAPAVNNTSANSMTILRPNLSAKTPEIGLAIKAKRLVADVMRLLSKVVSSREERSVPMETR